MSSENLSSEQVLFSLPSLDDDSLSASFEEMSEALKNFIEIRADIFMQKEEKIRQYQQEQLFRLKNEEDNYNKKCQDIEKKLAECTSQLNEIEHSCTDATKKLRAETEIKKKLNLELSYLLGDKNSMRNHFDKTYNLYRNTIQHYLDYLKIDIILDKEEPKLITVFFNNSQQYGINDIFLKFEVLSDFNFKLLEVHQDLHNKKHTFQELYSSGEVVSLIYRIHKGLESNENTIK